MAKDRPLMEQLAEAHEEVVSKVLGPVKESWREMMEERPWERLLAFFAAVDWREPWIVALLAAQVALFFSVVLLRRNTAYLTAVFVLGAGVILLGEQINTVGAAHWKRFATQPYFDQNGAFFAAVVAGPLVVTLLIVLIMYLGQVVAMMAEVKRRQLAAQRRRQAGGSGGAAEGKKQK